MGSEQSSKNAPEHELLNRLLGEVTQLNDEELDALCDAVGPQDDPRERIHRLAEEAAVTYRREQKLPPDHAQAALDATRTQTTLEGASTSGLKRIIDAVKRPVLGPVGDPSFAFQKKTELTEEDRRILEEQVKELAEDWEEKNEE
jgi:hypothetical protein